MSRINCVIIDDEKGNRELITSLITHLNEAYLITGEADGVESGFNLIKEQKPAVVFLDIRMQDGTGFNLLSKFPSVDFEVVFISGFDEYALKAFEYSALDYVLKPVDVQKFSETLSRVQKRILDHTGYFENLKRALQSYDGSELMITRLPIHHHDRVVLLDLKEVMYILSEEGYSAFYRSANEKYLSSKQLSDFAFILESFPNFIRVSKGCYININFISSYSKGLLSKVTLQDGSTHEISRRKKTEILDLLSQWGSTGSKNKLKE